MKKYFIGLLLVLFTSTAVWSAAPKHRNHLLQIEAADTAAYSDTSSVSAVAHAVQAAAALVASVGGIGVVIAILVGIFIIAIIVPVVFIVMLVRYLTKRQESQVQLTQKAMEMGVPLPQSAPQTAPTNRLWARGITNITLGIGLFLMFIIMGLESLSGIGLLVACLGGGTLYMAYRMDKQQKKRNDAGAPFADEPVKTEEEPTETND